MENPHKILVFRLSSIGDIILTTALVRCIRQKYSGSEITFIIKKEFYDIVKFNPNIYNIICFDKTEGFKGLRKLRSTVKNKNIDWFVDVHNNLRSNFIKTGLRVPYKTIYKKRIIKRAILIKTGISFYKDKKPVLLRYFEAAELFNVKYDNKGTEVYFKEENLNTVHELLKLNKYKSTKIAVVCPGASFKNKRWTAEGFAEVASYLLEEKKMFVVLLGGKNDTEQCQIINKIHDNKFCDLSGRLKLLDSAALLSLSSVVVTNDSGMLHMAQSQKKPVVAIFGPTTGELGYFPIPEKSRVAETNVKCRPCTPKGLDYCPKKHFRCMKDISPEKVIALINELLEE